jgi:hypothetical protein
MGAECCRGTIATALSPTRERGRPAFGMGESPFRMNLRANYRVVSRIFFAPSQISHLSSRARDRSIWPEYRSGAHPPARRRYSRKPDGSG